MVKVKKVHPSGILDISILIGFLVLLIGQWVFAIYVGLYHGFLIATRGLKGIGETHMPNGYISGDTAGNWILAVHLTTSIVIIGGGPLQLIPELRKRVPKFHRVVGRLYISFVLFAAFGGLYLTWFRPLPSISSIYQQVAISIEALLIIGFAAMALRFALARNIGRHRKWALRLFIVGSGVWFLRIGYMVWFFISRIMGIQWELFFDVWSYESFILPLLLLELFFLTEKNPRFQGPVSILILLFSMVMGLGVFLATRYMWLPRIQNVL